MIAQPCFAVEPWSRARDRARPRRARADRVGVRALERAHRPARQPGRGRAERHARARTSTRSTSCVRCRTPRPSYGYPESGQTIVNVTDGKIIRLLVDDEPFDVRYGKLLLARARARPARRRRCAARRVGFAGGRLRARALDAARLVRAARGRRDPLRGRADRRPAARRRAVGARSRTSPARDAHVRSARRRRARVAAQARGCFDRTAGAVLLHSTQAQPAADGRGDGSRRSTAPTGPTSLAESSPDVGRVTVDRGPRATGERLQRGEVPRLRLVEPALAPGDPRPGRSRRCRRRATPAGTGSSPSSASTSTSSGTTPTSSSRATPSSSRPCASASSTRSRPARAPSSARSRRRA